MNKHERDRATSSVKETSARAGDRRVSGLGERSISEGASLCLPCPLASYLRMFAVQQCPELCELAVPFVEVFCVI